MNASSVSAGRQVRSRRTQEQRSAETQTRVLEATIDCLVEYGYTGTTTQRVAARARVTRGALLHHFPSRTDLVAASVRHLAVRRAEEALQEFSRIARGENVVEEAIDLLWRVYQGPLFTAAVELVVAARTDPQLAAELEQVEPIVSSGLAAVGTVLAPKGVDPEVALDFANTVKDSIQGLLVSNFAASDRGRVEQRWQRLRPHLLKLAAVEFPQLAAVQR